MRRVAPDRAGRAASQNSWSVVKAKPISFSLATTIDQTIHTEKASRRLGTEIHRLRVAIFLPVAAQKSGSSGRQSVSTCLGVEAEAIGLSLRVSRPPPPAPGRRERDRWKGWGADRTFPAVQAGGTVRASAPAPSAGWRSAS